MPSNEAMQRYNGEGPVDPSLHAGCVRVVYETKTAVEAMNQSLRVKPLKKFIRRSKEKGLRTECEVYWTHFVNDLRGLYGICYWQFPTKVKTDINITIHESFKKEKWYNEVLEIIYDMLKPYQTNNVVKEVKQDLGKDSFFVLSKDRKPVVKKKKVLVIKVSEDFMAWIIWSGKHMFNLRNSSDLPTKVTEFGFTKTLEIFDAEDVWPKSKYMGQVIDRTSDDIAGFIERFSYRYGALNSENAHVEYCYNLQCGIYSNCYEHRIKRESHYKLRSLYNVATISMSLQPLSYANSKQNVIRSIPIGQTGYESFLAFCGVPPQYQKAVKFGDVIRRRISSSTTRYYANISYWILEFESDDIHNMLGQKFKIFFRIVTFSEQLSIQEYQLMIKSCDSGNHFNETKALFYKLLPFLSMLSLLHLFSNLMHNSIKLELEEEFIPYFIGYLRSSHISFLSYIFQLQKESRFIPPESVAREIRFVTTYYTWYIYIIPTRSLKVNNMNVFSTWLIKQLIGRENANLVFSLQTHVKAVQYAYEDLVRSTMEKESLIEWGRKAKERKLDKESYESDWHDGNDTRLSLIMQGYKDSFLICDGVTTWNVSELKREASDACDPLLSEKAKSYEGIAVHLLRRDITNMHDWTHTASTERCEKGQRTKLYVTRNTEFVQIIEKYFRMFIINHATMVRNNLKYFSNSHDHTYKCFLNYFNHKDYQLGYDARIEQILGLFKVSKTEMKSVPVYEIKSSDIVLPTRELGFPKDYQMGNPYYDYSFPYTSVLDMQFEVSSEFEYLRQWMNKIDGKTNRQVYQWIDNVDDTGAIFDPDKRYKYTTK